MHPIAAIFRSTIDALDALDLDRVVEYMADDVEITIRPPSIGVPTLGKWEFYKTMKEGFLSAWFAHGALKVRVEGAHVCVDEVYEVKAPREDVVVAHSDGTSKNGTLGHNEYVFFVEADASGRKIKKFTEFTDSGFMKSFMVAEEEEKKAGDGTR